MLDDLIEINRNANGDYYFIFSVNNVVNHIRPGSKSRNEVLIVGVPQSRLVSFLKSSCDVNGFKGCFVDKGEFYGS